MAFKASSLTKTLIAALVLLSSSSSSDLIKVSEAQTPPLGRGLSYTFYNTSCPQFESIVQTELQRVFNDSIGQAAGLLRLHFHDCFVQGCDGSVLLNGSVSGPGEQTALPNLSLRPQSFRIIENLHTLVNNACNNIVSCSDITALAARDAVALSGGPNYSVPFGRRDGLTFATIEETEANLPAPFNNTTTILNSLATKGFNPTDVVALSGGHTIGIASCPTFTPRLYPTRDPTMNQTLYNNLRATCPTANTTNTTFLDTQTPNVFDNRYYINLVNRDGLFTSDQDLFTDTQTSSIVTAFANNQTLFFESFVTAMIKMGELNVLTGSQGEIRANCSLRNSNNLSLLPDMGNGKGSVASYKEF